MIYRKLIALLFCEFRHMTENTFLKKLGTNVSKIRKSKGMTQLDLCVKIEMEDSYLSSIENGRQNPSALTLLKIAEGIGCEVQEFFEFEEAGK
jgi:transcriptional regulator with XRE-family HTH domain